MPSWIVRDYRCKRCGRTFEVMRDRSDTATIVTCCDGIECDTVPSTTHCKIPLASVDHGTGKERPPHVLDTRPLADGMSTSEWRAVQSKKRAERRYRQLKDL